MECEHCGFEAKSPAGLASHRRSKHPGDRGTSNLAAVEAMLTELRRMGRLADVDVAKVQALRSMAQALDDNPFNSQMWKHYWEAIEAVCEADDDADDRLAAAVAQIRGATEMGDSPPS